MSRADGFTLVETLIALVIASMLALSAGQSLRASINSAQRSRALLEATLIADHHLTSLRLLPPSSDASVPEALDSVHDTVEVNGRQYRVRTLLQPIPSARAIWAYTIVSHELATAEMAAVVRSR